jgi:hypothetical protein
VAINVPNPTAFSFGDDIGRGFFHGTRVRHRVPNVLRVIGLQLVIVHRLLLSIQS